MSFIKINIQKKSKFIVLSALLLTSLGSISVPAAKISADEVQENKNSSISLRGGWGLDALAGAVSGVLGTYSPTPTLSDLNGGKTKNFKPLTCGPYGKGGTPNSCQ